MVKEQQNLFDKTFDQQLSLSAGDVEGKDIAPNRRIPAEIVFEPLMTGVRVTARDAQHRVLWGYVGSQGTVKQAHCLVAVYDTLQCLVSEELGKAGLIVSSEQKDSLAAARCALDQLEETTRWLRASLDVKKVTEATGVRAKEICRIALDANRQILLDATSLKGMKSRAE